ncbi:MAG TPA: murein biosynthesis integral membrane protein MurJ [Nitrospirae bacterium]|nr:murein biosynthesis integral membrane protein MurJ [Nitrospirota bacterium]
MTESRKIARSASLISLATFLSRILGFVRDMVIAGFFGATGLSDTFFVAFRIPNLLRELFAEGSMSSAFIPVLTETKVRQGEQEARRLARITFSFIILVVGSICVAGIVFAPAIVRLIVPGFTDPARLATTVLLTRIMFPFLLFVSLAALTMGVLNVERVFFVPALSSAWFNIAIILTIVLLSPHLGMPILAVAIGATVGGVVQYVTQIPSYLRRGYTYGIDTAFGHEGLRKMAVLILPLTLGLAVSQINIFVSTILASYLPEGSITYLYYSMRLIQFPVGIFGVAMGMAALPALSSHAAKGDMEALGEDFSSTLRLLFFITVPSMAGLIALRYPIVNLLFQRGEFGYAATEGTAFALVFYSLGIWSMVGVRVVVAAFYSMQDTRTPVKVALLALATNIVLSLLLMGPLEHGGLALANSVSSGVNFSLLFYLLRRKISSVDCRRVLKSFSKTLAASLIMGVTAWSMLQGPLWKGGGEVLKKSLYLGGTILLCACLYFLTALMLRSEEVRTLFDLFRRGKGD